MTSSTTKSVRHLKAHGRYPKFVYRAFKEKSFAEDFSLRGRFRMGNLRVYASLEDARGDPSEGQGHFQRFGTVTTVDFTPRSDETAVAERPGYVDTGMELLNPKFVLSCSLPGVDLRYLQERFGPWLVRINEPRRLAREISDYLGTLSNRFAGGVEGCFVHYNKAGRVRAGLTDAASIRFSYSQKPVSFNQEREFRFVVIAAETPSTWFDGDHLPIDLGRALTYVTVI